MALLNIHQSHRPSSSLFDSLYLPTKSLLVAFYIYKNHVLSIHINCIVSLRWTWEYLNWLWWNGEGTLEKLALDWRIRMVLIFSFSRHKFVLVQGIRTTKHSVSVSVIQYRYCYSMVNASLDTDRKMNTFIMRNIVEKWALNFEKLYVTHYIICSLNTSIIEIICKVHRFNTAIQSNDCTDSSIAWHCWEFVKYL